MHNILLGSPVELILFKDIRTLESYIEDMKPRTITKFWAIKREVQEPHCSLASYRLRMISNLNTSEIMLQTNIISD